MPSSLVSTFRRTLVAAILASSPIGCSGSLTQPPTQPSWDGQVRVAGSVLDFRTNAAIGGARVTIGDATVATDDSGVYSLTVPAGNNNVSIDGESIGVVNMKDRTYRGDFYVHGTGCIARYGTVVDSETRQPVV